MGKPIGSGPAAYTLREVRRTSTQAAIERAGGLVAAARELGVDRQTVRSWLGETLALPTGEHAVAAAVLAERNRLVRDAVRRSDGFVKRAAKDLGVTRQTMKRWMIDAGMQQRITPSLDRLGRRASARRPTAGMAVE